MEPLLGIVFSMAHRLWCCEHSLAEGSICVALHAGYAEFYSLLTYPAYSSLDISDVG